MRALVTNGSYLHTVGIVRHLGKEGIDVSVIGTSRLDVALHSRYCRKAIIGPSSEDEENWVNFLRELVEAEPFDILIPVGFLTTRIVSSHRKELEPFVKIELAEHDSIEIASNKGKAYRLAESMGISYPKTLYPRTLNEAEELSLKLAYPVVIKPLFEAGKQAMAYPENRKVFLKSYRKICSELTSTSGRLPMVQEYVDSNVNLSFCAIYQRGKCKQWFMYKEIRSIPTRGGSSSYAQSFYDAEVKAYSTKLLDQLHWHGVAQVEYKRGSDRRLELMEINPKFWASLDVALQAGVNFPYYLCEMAQGKELDYSEEYDRNLRFHFPSRELKHIRERPSSISRVILDSLNPKVKSNIWLSDFKPNFIELVFGLASLLPARIRSLLKKMIKVGEDYGEKA